jgi:hypothetical protein
MFQEVLLWRTFGRISRGLDGASVDVSDCATEWAGDTELTKEANEWASISLTNQKVVDALMESLENGCVSVNI